MTIFDTAREKLRENKYLIEFWNILIKDAQVNNIKIDSFIEHFYDHKLLTTNKQKG